MKVQYLASSSTKRPCFEDESSDFDRFIHKKGVFCGQSAVFGKFLHEKALF